MPEGLAQTEGKDTLTLLQNFLDTLKIPIDLKSSPEELINNLEKVALKYFTPLVIDLDGSDIETTVLEEGVLFDMDADGHNDKTAWIKSGSGFLVWDKNQDGIVNDGSEMFGEGMSKTNGGKYENGVAALAELDSNHDHIFDKQDENWGRLQIWHDKNENGLTESGELSELADWHIEAISLSFEQIDLLDE